MSQDRLHNAPPAPVLQGRMVASRRLRHHYLEAGRGDGLPVILLHGLASLAQEMMAALAEPLTDAGYRVIAFDRPGYGFSDAAERGDMSPGRQAEALAQAVAQLGARGGVLVGHSVGCATALLMAEQPAARVAGLVLVNPFCRPTRPAAAPGLRAATAPMIGPAIRRVLPRLAGPLGRRMVRAGLHDDQPAPDPRAFPWRKMAQSSAVMAMADELLGFNADMTALRTRLRRLSVPTVILADADDPVIESEGHVRWLERRMPVTAVRWSRVGHLLHHADPEAVVDAVQTVDVARQVGMRRIA